MIVRKLAARKVWDGVSRESDECPVEKVIDADHEGDGRRTGERAANDRIDEDAAVIGQAPEGREQPVRCCSVIQETTPVGQVRSLVPYPVL